MAHVLAADGGLLFIFSPKQLRVIEQPKGRVMKKPRLNPRRRRLREVSFRDQIEVCGVTLQRQTLPNGKRVFEEEGVRELLVGNIREPSPGDFVRFEEFTRPEARH